MARYVPPPVIPADEVAAFYAAITSGEIVLVASRDPQVVYASNVEYRASNGWVIVVFNDANEFDYIDHITSPDGREIDLNQIERTPLDWVPDEETAWALFGIPGHRKFRCRLCGAVLPVRPADGAFLCGSGRCVGLRNPAVPTRIDVQDATGR